MDDRFILLDLALLVLAVLIIYFLKFRKPAVSAVDNNGGAVHDHREESAVVPVVSVSSVDMGRQSSATRIRDPVLSSREPAYNVANCILSRYPQIRKRLSNEIAVPSQTTEWILIFSSDYGRSFPRLVSALACARGPVLMIIEEEVASSQSNGANPSDSSSSPSPSVFGGVTLSSPWLCVKQREQNAVSAAASRARDKRIGRTPVEARRAQPHNSPFFGSDDCFVFKLRSESQTGHEDDVLSIHKPRPGRDQFQYFFDVCPSSSDKVGIGMGGDGETERGWKPGAAGGSAWFVDRTMCRGESSAGGCLTFRDLSSSLSNAAGFSSSSTTFSIKSFEVYALDPATVGSGDAGMYASYQDGETGAKIGSSLKSREHATVKALFQLNGGTLYSEREDLPCGCE